MDLPVKKGGLVFVPTHAVPYRDTWDDASDGSTIYDEEPVVPELDPELAAPGQVDIAKRRLLVRDTLFDLGLDSDALPMRNDLIYRDVDKAGGFTPMLVDGNECEIPSVVLWDYFGGPSFMDLNCTARDFVNVVAEEWQVRVLQKDEHGEAVRWVRLPMQWSLARWQTGKAFQPITGMIPSHWLVSKKFYDDHPALFVNPEWFLGCCDVSYAHSLLYTKDAKPGDFVIYSPVWLNPNPSEPRPWYLMVVMDTDDEWERVKEGAKKTPQPDPTYDYPVRNVVIGRNCVHKYVLLGRSYDTLYDLVFHLSVDSTGPLPLLNYQTKYKHRADWFKYPLRAMPAPQSQPQRDPAGLPMRCEQWASCHYDQVTEPSLLSSAFTYVSRSILDPLKKSHAKWANTFIGENKIVMMEKAREYLSRFAGGDASKKDAPAPPSDESVLTTHNKAMLNCNDVKFDIANCLGSGAFGSVYKGELRQGKTDIPVAIKELKLIVAERDLRMSWISEMEIMQLATHPNCARFYGWCLDAKRQHALLCMEVIAGGSLKDFVEKRNAASVPLSEHEQIDFAVQMSRGVGYLHSLDPPVVHGDLAARNFLLQAHPVDRTRYTVKVTDFGISKIVRHDAHAYYDDPHKIPYKWLAPEVLMRREMSPKGDVWSLGMTFMELYGLGEPYGMTTADKITSFLNDGHRMPRLPSQPHWMYDIVLQCWRAAPADRPTCREVELRLLPYLIECEKGHIDAMTRWMQQVDAKDAKKREKEAENKPMAEKAMQSPNK